MRNINRRLAALTLGITALATVTVIAQIKSGDGSANWTPKPGEWAWYTADIRGSKYLPLDQINAKNFNDLEVAWRFKTDNLGSRPEYKLEGTPLVINGRLYTTAGARRERAAGVERSRPGVLDGRTRRRSRALHHAWLPADCAQCKDGPADSHV